MNVFRRLLVRKRCSGSSAAVVTRNYRKVKEGCECPEPPKTTKVVQEKQCVPCSFVTWKPKPRKVIEEKLKEDRKPKKPMTCYAGMVLRKPAPKCKTADIDPFKKKCCLQAEAGEQTKVSTSKTSEIQIPIADWDFNCKT